MEALFFFLHSLSLVFGVFFGGLLAAKAFGIPKRLSLFIIEIVLLILLITYFISSLLRIEALATELFLCLPLFLIGFASSLASRGAITLAGKIGMKVKEKVGRESKRMEELLIKLVLELRRLGLEEKEIRKLLLRLGFKEEEIKRACG